MPRLRKLVSQVPGPMYSIRWGCSETKYLACFIPFKIVYLSIMTALAGPGILREDAASFRRYLVPGTCYLVLLLLPCISSRSTSSTWYQSTRFTKYNCAPVPVHMTLLAYVLTVGMCTRNAFTYQYITARHNRCIYIYIASSKTLVDDACRGAVVSSSARVSSVYVCMINGIPVPGTTRYQCCIVFLRQLAA